MATTRATRTRRRCPPHDHADVVGQDQKAVTIGTGLFFLQQMSGVNAIVYFSSAMFVAAGVESAGRVSRRLRDQRCRTMEWPRPLDR